MSKSEFLRKLLNLCRRLIVFGFILSVTSTFCIAAEENVIGIYLKNVPEHQRVGFADVASKIVKKETLEEDDFESLSNVVENLDTYLKTEGNSIPADDKAKLAAFHKDLNAYLQINRDFIHCLQEEREVQKIHSWGKFIEYQDAPDGCESTKKAAVLGKDGGTVVQLQNDSKDAQRIIENEMLHGIITKKGLESSVNEYLRVAHQYTTKKMKVDKVVDLFCDKKVRCSDDQRQNIKTLVTTQLENLKTTKRLKVPEIARNINDSVEKLNKETLPEVNKMIKSKRSWWLRKKIIQDENLKKAKRKFLNDYSQELHKRDGRDLMETKLLHGEIGRNPLENGVGAYRRDNIEKDENGQLKFKKFSKIRRDNIALAVREKMDSILEGGQEMLRRERQMRENSEWFQRSGQHQQSDTYIKKHSEVWYNRKLEDIQKSVQAMLKNADGTVFQLLTENPNYSGLLCWHLREAAYKKRRSDELYLKFGIATLTIGAGGVLGLLGVWTAGALGWIETSGVAYGIMMKSFGWAMTAGFAMHVGENAWSAFSNYNAFSEAYTASMIGIGDSGTISRKYEKLEDLEDNIVSLSKSALLYGVASGASSGVKYMPNLLKNVPVLKHVFKNPLLKYRKNSIKEQQVLLSQLFKKKKVTDEIKKVHEILSNIMNKHRIHLFLEKIKLLKDGERGALLSELSKRFSFFEKIKLSGNSSERTADYFTAILNRMVSDGTIRFDSANSLVEGFNRAQSAKISLGFNKESGEINFSTATKDAQNSDILIGRMGENIKGVMKRKAKLGKKWNSTKRSWTDWAPFRFVRNVTSKVMGVAFKSGKNSLNKTNEIKIELYSQSSKTLPPEVIGKSNNGWYIFRGSKNGAGKFKYNKMEGVEKQAFESADEAESPVSFVNQLIKRAQSVIKQRSAFKDQLASKQHNLGVLQKAAKDGNKPATLIRVMDKTDDAIDDAASVSATTGKIASQYREANPKGKIESVKKAIIDIKNRFFKFETRHAKDYENLKILEGKLIDMQVANESKGFFQMTEFLPPEKFEVLKIVQELLGKGRFKPAGWAQARWSWMKWYDQSKTTYGMAEKATQKAKDTISLYSSKLTEAQRLGKLLTPDKMKEFQIPGKAKAWGNAGLTIITPVGTVVGSLFAGNKLWKDRIFEAVEAVFKSISDEIEEKLNLIKITDRGTFIKEAAKVLYAAFDAKVAETYRDPNQTDYFRSEDFAGDYLYEAVKKQMGIIIRKHLEKKLAKDNRENKILPDLEYLIGKEYDRILSKEFSSDEDTE